MKDKKIFIIGAGGHALVVADALKFARCSVAGYVDTVNHNRKGEQFGDSTIIGDWDDLKNLSKNGDIYVALGFGDCQGRFMMLNRILGSEFNLLTVVHPTAAVSEDVDIEAGVFIGANAVIETGCRIAAGSIINCSATVCHGTIVGEAAAVCPGVSIGGDVKVGACTWLGIGSSVIEKVSIGDNCYVGAGAVVIRDIPDNTLSFGVPAKVIKKL